MRLCQAHPEHVSDQGKNLRQDRFYHGLLPHLCNALGFAMADLPEREQADTSFDTLYTLAKKMELISLPASRDCLHWDTFCKWHKEHLNSQGVGLDNRGVPTQGPITEVVPVVTMGHSSSFLNNGSTAHWIGPKTLVDIMVEGREAIALVDSGSQVNIMTSTYVRHHEFPILPLEELVDHSVNLVGLGGGHTSPLGFIILQVHTA